MTIAKAIILLNLLSFFLSIIVLGRDDIDTNNNKLNSVSKVCTISSVTLLIIGMTISYFKEESMLAYIICIGIWVLQIAVIKISKVKIKDAEKATQGVIRAMAATSVVAGSAVGTYVAGPTGTVVGTLVGNSVKEMLTSVSDEMKTKDIKPKVIDGENISNESLEDAYLENMIRDVMPIGLLVECMGDMDKAVATYKIRYPGVVSDLKAMFQKDILDVIKQ